MKSKPSPQFSPLVSRKVKTLVTYGYKRELIAIRLGLSEKELERLYGRELDVALPENKAMMAARLFQQATGGNLAAICFWLKIHAGWSEKRHEESPQPAEDSKNKAPDWFYYVCCMPTMPCNTRDRCFKSGPKQRLVGFQKVLTKLVARANERGLDLNFQRPKKIDLPEIKGIYGWPHRDSNGEVPDIHRVARGP